MAEYKRDSNLKLGQKTAYINQYDPSLLFPVTRKNKRDEIGIDSNNLPFNGYDIWNHYEVSWLNSKGKPVVAIAEISYDCTTSNIIESKSLKLYFNSFNNTKINSIQELENIISKDLSQCVKGAVVVKIIGLSSFNKLKNYDINQINFNNIFDNIIYLDNLNITCDKYLVYPDYLSVENNNNTNIISENLYSDLLKSNCLVTNQPDWGSVVISYTGNKINHEGLLKYIISYRDHNEFHEQCVERIFYDILTYCKPLELTVFARYTRRGGIDINPYRTNKINKLNKLNELNQDSLNYRLIRQ